MSVARTVQSSLRRSFQPSALTRSSVNKFSPPAIIAATNQFTQKRFAATQKVTQDDGYQILVKQRLQRPVAPHLSIYRYQTQMMASITNRITGCILSGAFYVFGFGYLISPLTGIHMESVTMAAAFGAWPVAAKIATKAFFAWPFAYHFINGMRHLVWDTARGLGHKQFVRSSTFVWIASTLAAAGIAYI